MYLSQIFRTLLACFFMFNFTSVYAENRPANSQTPSVVNLYNFIRKTTNSDGKFNHADYETVVIQLELNKQYGLPATYALKYDALMDKRFQKLLKKNIDKNDEIGAWWEITRELAKKAGVKWLGHNDISLHVNEGYSLAYEVADRKKMLDVYMSDFKKVWGYYPKSIGSWVMDIESYRYAYERYGVIAGTICRDQIGVDGFTLVGGYYDQAYYPSIKNEFMPAQSIENQLNMPIFRLLGPDPIYNFEDGIRDGIGGVYSMEPVWECGKSSDWVDWYFKSKNDETKIGYSYTQVGQENTFLWGNMKDGYEMQIPKIAELAKRGKIRLELLSESAKWFKSKYRLTPPATVTTSTDWHDNNLSTFWYSGRNYRTSMLWDKGQFYFRDLFIFDENYPSRYLTSPLNDKLSVFDALPIVDAHRWKKDDVRAKLSPVLLKSGKVYPLKGEKPEYSSKGDDKFIAVWNTSDKRNIKIECFEDRIEVFHNSADWGLLLNKVPVLKGLFKDKMVCSHNKFTYNLYADKGSFRKHGDRSVIIMPEDGKIILRMCDKKDYTVNSFLTEKYNNDGSIYEKNYRFKPEISLKSRKNIRAIRPLINPILEYKLSGETTKVEITNKQKGTTVRYTTDGTEPNKRAKRYNKPIEIDESTTIKARAFKRDLKPSRITESKIYRSIKMGNITAITDPTPDKSYNKNGAYDLIDGVKGSNSYRDGNWLGYLDDMDVVIKNDNNKSIKRATITFLQNTRAWIFYPVYVSVSVSDDNKNFKEICRVNHVEENPVTEIGRKDFSLNFSPGKYRYIKLFAKWVGPCPKWSPCAGQGDAYMFVDEICLE